MGGGVNVTKIMVVLMVVALAESATGLTDAQCHEEKRKAWNACKSLLQVEVPSPQCCERVKMSHSKCICPAVTPDIINKIGGVDRAIRLVKICHREIPHHFKCGSVTTP